MDDRISELPDCILSYILTMLSVKDLLRTTVLSKRWCKLWALRRDLFFDIFMLGSSEEELLETGYVTDDPIPSMYRSIVNIDTSRDEFVKRVNQFVKNFPGTNIDSFLVNFSLDCEHGNTIDQWISFAIARGVGKINLLFLGRPYAHRIPKSKHYTFDFGLFSTTNASALKHLHLQCCLVRHSTKCDFIPFKSLRFLSLESVKLDEMFFESMLSNCRRLEELCLIFCEFKSSMPKIISSSLCHLKVTRCYFISNNIQVDLNLILVDCLKLTSLQYHGYDLDTLNINTPILKCIHFIISKKDLNKCVALCATFPELQILHVDTSLTVTISLKITQPLKHLKQLNFVILYPYILDYVEYDPLWILNILQISPLLQNLSIMFKNSEFLKYQKDIRDIVTFSHDEVKIIELRGCVGNWFEIEFVMNILKHAQKLEQIVVMSPSCNCGRELMRERMGEKLQSLVGLEKLVFI